MKLSKPQISQHNKAVALLQKEKLTFEDKIFVLENWFPSYNNQIGLSGTFFTPEELARDFTIEIGGRKIIDLCAGIGTLSFYYYHYNSHNEKAPQITCIEYNPEFVEVGKKVFPEATWICGDMCDEQLIKSLGKFDMVIGNPPFGKIKSNCSSSWLSYKGSEAEYKCVAIGKHLARNGTFIMPQSSCPFMYSGINEIKYTTNDKLEKFKKETGIVLGPNCGIDTSRYKDDWKGANPTVEIVTVEYEEIEFPKSKTSLTLF